MASPYRLPLCIDIPSLAEVSCKLQKADTLVIIACLSSFSVAAGLADIWETGRMRRAVDQTGRQTMANRS